MAARLVGADEYAEKQFREAAETERKIQERYAPAVPSYKDIKGLGTGLTYLVESVGELIPSILPSLFTGGVAAVVGRGAIIAAKEAAEKAAQKEIAERGVQALTQKEVADQIRNAGIDAATKTAIKYQGIGAIGGSSLQNVPEVFQNIKEETGEESIGTALAFGGFNSILDAALPLSLMIKARKAGIPSNELAAEWYKRFGKGALKGFATEGATEAAQEMSSAAAEKFVDNNIDFFSERNFERFINAGLKGGLGGGVVSGATDVVLGRKPLTEADKPLDEDIRNTQSDILARRALLDELRAQAAEEGRNRLDPEALKDLGFGTKYSLYNSLLNKDINDPVQAQEVLSLLQAAIDAPETKGRERVVAANTLDVVNQYLSSVGDLDVGQVITEPVGAGISVPATPVEPTVTEGVGGVERTGVAPVVPDVGAPVVGEEVASAPVTPTAAAPVQPIAEPAPVEAAAPADVLPTTQQLIAEQEAAIASQMEKFQNLLKQQIDRFGLKDVAVRVVDDMQNANAQYTKGLIKLAVDAADPVRDLRHESVHALKELGFFSPAQWQALVRRANESWINTYLQNRDIDGNFIEPGKESRYDAYIKLFKQQGLDEAQTQEALVEEAISDAFGDFSLTKAPPGMMQAILNRMKKFFRAIKETVTGSGVVDPEEIFGKIEKAEIAAPAKPKSEVAAPQEKRTAPEEAVPTEGKADEEAKPRAEPRFTIKQVPTAGRPEPSRDRGGRDQGRSLAPLAGAPTVPNATGPDANLVRVAEEYAERNGIPLERQPEYVEVDEDRARRIAQAYEDMPHAPRDPKVREAYADLIRQTRAQYDALIDDGYEFTFFDGNTDPYGGNPFNAMRDLRQNKRMAVYGTYDGYGTEGITGAAVEDNPMLADTGLRWEDQAGVEHMVTANDLFRAVHDAFGHGLEGAGFRARGEENAWQAHARLFTGPALHALTSETRGQNSWLNFGPYGEKNRTAKLEDTVFAEQKTGLMPEWTWQEGLLKDAKPDNDSRFSLRGEVPLSTRVIMESNDDFARAELGLNIKPKKGIANKVRDIAIALNEQTKREQGAMNRQKLTIENEKAIANAIADEVAYQLTAGKRKTGTGLGWYSNNYPRAVKRLGDIFQELATNRHARSVFTALVAVTSNGEKVTKNIDNAITLYEKLRDGKPMFAMSNRRATALINNLQVIQDLLAKHGTNFEKVLLQEITVKDMNAKLREMGKKSDGSYLANTRVPAAAVYFGPKLGAFYANLSGSEGYLTMDLWWTRSINRMRGLLIPKATDASIAKLKEMIGDASMTRENLVAATVPLRNKYKEFGFTTELEHLVQKKEPSTKGAKPAWFAKAKRVAGPAYDQLVYDHNLEKMANTIYKNEFEGLEEAPFTANDRAFMYRAARRAQAQLRSDGIDLTLADIQAALWYYEKRLYEKLSGKKADDIGYEEAILAQADQTDRRAGSSVVFPERDGRGAVATGEVAGATGIRGEPSEGRPEKVTPKYSISGKSERQRSNAEILADAVGDVPGLDAFNLEDYTDTEVELSNIEATTKGQGAGTEAMRRLVRAADENGVDLMLIPAGKGQRREQLMEFYSRFGFDEDGEVMRRAARPAAQRRLSLRQTDTPELREAAEKSAIVDKDGNLIPMYHGTGALIRIFRPKQAGATFVSPSPDFASGFTSTSRLWMVRHIGQFLKPDEIKKAVQELRQTVYSQYGKQSKTTQKFMDEIYEVLKEAKETGLYNFEGELEDSWYQIAFDMIPGAKERVMELYVLAKNPFDFEKKDDVNKVIKKMLLDPEVKRQYGYEIAPKGVDIFKPENFMLRQTLERNNKDYKAAVEAKFKDGLSRGRWTAIETPEVQRAIRGLDFDSFYVFEGGVKNLGVYDPKLIKSADENFGPFGQRPPSEEEARAADMTPEEALQAQMEGDIRFSLRAPQTPEFKRWFGDSKVVDENGEPLVVYHGAKEDIADGVFRMEKGMLGIGAYFTSNPKEAEFYTQNAVWRTNANIVPVYVSIQNPYYTKDKWDKGALKAKENGFDGVILLSPSGGIEWAIPFKPEQIKSAIGNIGTFDPTNPDIRFSLRAREVPKSSAMDFFEAAKGIPRTEGIEAAEDAWSGGIADFGDPEAAQVIGQMPGYYSYQGEIETLAWEHLSGGIYKKDKTPNKEAIDRDGKFFVYRYGDIALVDRINNGEIEGSFEPDATTLSINFAKAFKNFAGFDELEGGRENHGWMRLAVKPESIVMLGTKPSEMELVIDFGLVDPGDAEVIDESFRPELPEAKFSLRSKPFDRDSLPTNNKEYTLPQNTILYHGAYKTVSDAIESVGYLTSRPKIKAHGGLMNEGGLVWFGSKETAQKYANSEADPGKVQFDREAGIIREPGKVFEAITDRPYKLISRYKVLSAKEANALNEALGLPDYKRLTAGDSADTAAYRAAVYSNSNAERFEIKSGKYTETVSAPWPIILKTLNADGFYSDGTVALTAENGIRLSEEGKPMERFSLRSALDPAINARILQTTTERDEASFPQRITDAIGPQSRSRFRAAALNRYNRLGELDKEKMAKMGGAELLADSNAESAALLSDLSAGIVAGALGVYDGVGGVPVYKHHFVVERQIMGPRGPQFVVVGGKIQSRQAAEALARRYPNSKVKERGFTAVSNLNNTVEGPLKIFTDLAKMGDPYAYRAYQYWAGVKRGSKWMTVTQGPQKGQVVEQLFEPADIQKAEKLRQEFKQKYKIDFEKIQKEWIKYNDELVQYALDTGVISKENAEKFRKHGDYIPFYRQINGEDDAVGPRIFQSISAVQAPRKIKGGEDPLGDFLENVVRNTQSIVQAGLKNVAARRAADQGMDLGFVNQISQSQASPVNSFYVLEDGKKVYYDTSDVLLIDSIKSLGMPEIPLIGLLAGPANTLRNLVTKDPGFMLANMMRDSLAAWNTSGVNMLPIAATLKNFTEALAGTSPEYKALLMGGVVGGYDYSQGTKDAAKQFGKELRKAAGAKTLGEKALTPFTSVWDALEKGTQASDAATRIEVYKQTLKDTGNEAEALFRALEVMNFNRKGNNPIVRVATAAIPFLNARMQGLDVLYRAGLGKNATANAKEIQKAFWRRGMYMAALSTMYWMLTHDDEEYKKQEQETKDNNWLFPSLGIKIPIPFEIGVLFKVVPERIAALTLGDDTAKDFTKSMVRNLANTLAFNPIPQTFVPIVEAVTNYDFFTMRPIVGQGLEGVAPEYQIGPRTSRLGETLGKAIGISPMKVDQIIQGYTGTLGQYMSDLIDSVYDLHTENPKASKRFEQMPVFKRFMIDPDARGQVTAYFDLKNAVDEATRTANLLERSMDFKEWGKYYSENIGLFAVKDYVLDMDKTLKEYREMKNMIRSLPMDADAKRDNIRAITQIENMMVSNIQLLKANMLK